MEAYEVLQYATNAIAKLAQTLRIMIEQERDSEIKILSRVLQLIEKGETIDEILIVSEGEPCDSCDKMLKEFAKKFPQIKVRVQWFYVKMEGRW